MNINKMQKEHNENNKNNKRVEILAPCGSEESLEAALNGGADAVYLGMSSFSARRNAVNFNGEQLKMAVKKAHRQGVRVFVTLNILVFDDEISQLEKTINEIQDSEADGVIVQDWGVVSKIKEIAPKLRLHASTQMTITSASGAEFAKKQGFSRVVLPRELSLEEIKEITSKVDIETEVFVHGALCVCISGQCLLSAMLGGRSGNRGLCAQPCRLNYRCGNRENVLSLKDLSLIDNLLELEQAGVTSAKIEGRMKRPEYVFAAVSQCRAVLRGEKADKELLRTVFSRSGFTKGYYESDLSQMSGIRQKEDAEGSEKALAKLRQMYKSPYKRFTLDFDIKIKKNSPVLCKVLCRSNNNDFQNISLTITGNIPEEAINRSITEEEVKSRMVKLGGTVFSAGQITCEIDNKLSVSAAEINELRRKAVSMTEDIIEDNLKSNSGRE